MEKFFIAYSESVSDPLACKDSDVCLCRMVYSVEVIIQYFDKFRGKADVILNADKVSGSLFQCRCFTGDHELVKLKVELGGKVVSDSNFRSIGREIEDQPVHRKIDQIDPYFTGFDVTLHIVVVAEHLCGIFIDGYVSAPEAAVIAAKGVVYQYEITQNFNKLGRVRGERHLDHADILFSFHRTELHNFTLYVEHQRSLCTGFLKGKAQKAGAVSVLLEEMGFLFTQDEEKHRLFHGELVRRTNQRIIFDLQYCLSCDQTCFN